MKRILVPLLWLLFLVMMTSCGRDIPTAPASEPTSAISFSEAKIPLDDQEYLYRQIIAPSEKAQGSEYAYHLQTLSGELPQDFEADGEGWLWFGDDIWTEKAALIIDYTSQDGKIKDMVTGVSIRCRAADGRVSEISSAFRSTRIIGSIINPSFRYNGANTGCGAEFGLREVIGDIFVEGLYAHHYMYRLNLLSSGLEVVNYGTWHSSLQMADIRKVILNAETTPAITPTPDNHYTQFECYVVTRQGVEEATRSSVYFHAQAGYKPKAMLYHVAGLGAEHFSIVNDDQMMSHELIPSPTANKNRRLWAGDDCLEAIWSADFKLYLQWGYYGQYGFVTSGGNIVYTDNPWEHEVNICLDANTYENYGSRVEFFDLRWDNQPFPALGCFINPQPVSHQDGSVWLRVRNYNADARHHTFEGLAPGMHQFEVCAVDLQNVLSTPVVQSINLVPYKPYSQRSGILIVDDDIGNTYSPDAYVDNFYNSVVSSTYGPVQTVELSEALNTVNISPVLMQNYRGLVWHADNPSHGGYLSFNVDALNIYLSNAGRMMLSGTNKLGTHFYEMSSHSDFLQRCFGISNQQQYGYLSNSLAINSFFVAGLGLDGMPNIDLELDDAFIYIVEMRQGLSAVTWFNSGMDVGYLYQFGCKPVTADYPPTQEQYDLYSSKYVGFMHQEGDAKVAVFGFPLSYMEIEDVDLAMDQLLLQLLGPAK